MRLALAVILLVAASATLGAQEKSKAAATRDRINKVWDEKLARMLRAHVTAQCREEAAKAYSAIRFNKRRVFVDECVSQRLAAAAAPAGHQAQ